MLTYYNKHYNRILGEYKVRETIYLEEYNPESDELQAFMDREIEMC